MKILGVEANVGSMLFPFQEAGHTIIGNYDSRGIVNEENFLINFPDSIYFEDIEDILDIEDIDVIMSQPSCSKFSQLSRRDRDDYENDETIDLAFYYDRLKPKHFIIESKLEYIHEMPIVKGYRYQIEWVSNYHYGNTQQGRNRLWVIATREDVDYEFRPLEKVHTNTVASVIEGLPNFDIDLLDHHHIYKPFIKNSITKEYLSLDEAFDMLETDGKLSYTAADGTTKTRINRKMANPITSTTITGGGTWFHWEKKYPLTLREKARIQGFPDDFSFKGLTATKKDKAVGKSMPMEFTRHLVKTLEDSNYPEKSSKLVPEPVKLVLFKKKMKKQGEILLK